MWRLLATIGTLVFPAQTLAVTPYSITVSTGKLIVTLNVTDGLTTTTTRLLLGSVEGAAFGEMIGILSPVFELSELTFEVFEGGTVMDLLGSSEIPVTLTIDPGTLWEYQLNPSFLTADPAQERRIDTGTTTTFALSGEVELLGELIPFSFTRADVIPTLPGVPPHIVNAVNVLPNAEATTAALSEFWLVDSLSANQDLRTRGELWASEFAEVQGLILTLRAHLEFGTTEIANAAPTAIGSPGSPDGVAISPEVAAWLKRAKIHVLKNWVVPPGFRTQALEARVEVDLDASGEVRGTPRLSRRSGNPWYDEGVIRAIQKSSPLPPPPEAGKWNFVFMPEDSY